MVDVVEMSTVNIHHSTIIWFYDYMQILIQLGQNHLCVLDYYSRENLADVFNS